MTDALRPGLTGEVRRRVTQDMTADAYGVVGVKVLATPAMIALMELASWQAVQSALEPGMTSVGSELNVRHLAPTPVGDVVRVRSELLEVQGRRLTFRVEAWDSAGQVGEGVHSRFVVSQARFLERLSSRAPSG
ncbi:MAG: thioesterase family protein [Chloroflexota bacterium]